MNSPTCSGEIAKLRQSIAFKPFNSTPVDGGGGAERALSDELCERMNLVRVLADSGAFEEEKK